METKGSLKETEKDQTSLRYVKSFKNSSEVVQRDHGERERSVIFIVRAVSMKSGAKANYLGLKMEVGNGSRNMRYLKGIRVCSTGRKAGKGQLHWGICFWFFSMEKNGQVLHRRKTNSKWEVEGRRGRLMEVEP